MMRTLFIALFCLIIDPVLSQQIRGTTVDDETSQPLSYVHIGIPQRGIGTISDEAGLFVLSLLEDFSKDTVVFSMVGYESYYLTLDNQALDPKIIKLKPASVLLKEIVVTDKKEKRPTSLFGRTMPSKWSTGASGITDYGIGQEIGTVIKNDGENYIIHSVSFHHKSNTVDSILYRINIYDLNDRGPDKSLIHNELFVVAHKRDKWIHLNIEDQFIPFDQDLFVGVELVRRWDNKGDNRLFYSHGTGCDECQAFIRPTSQAKWTRLFAFPMTLYMTVEKADSQ